MLKKFPTSAGETAKAPTKPQALFSFNGTPSIHTPSKNSPSSASKTLKDYIRKNTPQINVAPIRGSEEASACSTPSIIDLTSPTTSEDAKELPSIPELVKRWSAMKKNQEDQLAKEKDLVTRDVIRSPTEQPDSLSQSYLLPMTIDHDTDSPEARLLGIREGFGSQAKPPLDEKQPLLDLESERLRDTGLESTPARSTRTRKRKASEVSIGSVDLDSHRRATTRQRTSVQPPVIPTSTVSDIKAQRNRGISARRDPVSSKYNTRRPLQDPQTTSNLPIL
ncbi:hypothetical protein F4804DRAFT_299989 [Jackrogersella minutella]|nr:hypothetical protein F4804DRAFT_299989 [Jackrogersella minutella]